jgi:CspA family cold shock protein
MTNVIDKKTKVFFGKVKFYRPDKGFGFLVPEKGEKDIYVRADEIKRSNLALLFEGQSVSYALLEENGKLIAKDIKVVKA